MCPGKDIVMLAALEEKLKAFGNFHFKQIQNT